MRVIKIPHDIRISCTVHDVDQDKCLDQMKQLISIEWAEIVLTILKDEDPHRDYCLIVDEVGKLKEGWIEKINPRASMFYAGTNHGDPIVGDVILCARQWIENFGECDLAGLTDPEIKGLKYLMLDITP